MNIPKSPRWNLTPRAAIATQADLARRVITQDCIGELRLVAGVDVGFEGDANKIACAAVVVLDFPTLTLVAQAIARAPVKFPYIPGLLSFREIPVILRALARLAVVPDVLIVDGQGRAHPRRFGLASHLGVLLDLPTLGCAKSILCGRAVEPANQVGAWSPLVDRDEVIGAAMRTRANVAPVYVSVGHRVSLERAIMLVGQCVTRYRLPEPTRLAHRAAGGEKIIFGATRRR